MKPLANPVEIIQPDRSYGASILRVASQFAVVGGHHKTTAATEAFNDQPELMAMGVNDESGKVVGILTRVHLFELLGRPFGREIVSRRQIADVAHQAPVFGQHQNLFHIAQQLESQIESSTIRYFILSDSDGIFKGIFSSKDLLFYLSRMTQDDIELAARLQERMVKPQEIWAGEGWEARAFSATAKGVGGDFYFYKKISSTKHFFALGDVSGKGVAASILTSLLWGTLKTYDYGQGLGELITLLNESLIQTFHLEKYLTAVFMILDESKRMVKIADMGHGHAALIRKGQAKSLQMPKLNLPIGIELGIKPQIYRLALEPGDLLIAYTDGIPEQGNPSGEEFGEAALLRAVLNHHANPATIPGLLHDEVTAWRATLPQQDDITWFQLAIDRKK